MTATRPLLTEQPVEAGTWALSPEGRFAQVCGQGDEGEYLLDDAVTGELFVLKADELSKWRRVTPAAEEAEDG